MQQLFILEFICLLLQFVKAQHDSSVVDIQDYNDPSYANASKSWHGWSAFNYVIVVITFSWLGNHWAWIAPLLLVRLTFFSLIFQIQRSEKKGIFYLSDKGFDLTMKTILGKNAGFWQFILGLVSLILSNVLIYKFHL